MQFVLFPWSKGECPALEPSSHKTGEDIHNLDSHHGAGHSRAARPALCSLGALLRALSIAHPSRLGFGHTKIVEPFKTPSLDTRSVSGTAQMALVGGQ